MGETYETQLGTARLYQAAKTAYAPVDMRTPYSTWIAQPVTNTQPTYNSRLGPTINDKLYSAPTVKDSIEKSYLPIEKKGPTYGLTSQMYR